jgi:site-specific DNA-methyltransferase (adenine-specific)|tara:strand:- start:6598 stop:7449 length:852 start_codon:yes stop_codon:yes gene_type:complete
MTLEINKVHLMNNIEGTQLMEPDSVNLVVTSPPYDNLREYNDSSSWNFDVFKKVADGLIRVLKPGGVIAWNVADAIVELHKKQGTSRTGSSFRQCLYFQEQGLNFHDLIIYEKPAARFSASVTGLRYSDVFEYVFIMTKGKPDHMQVIADKKNKGFGTTFTKDGGRNKDGTRNRDAKKTQIAVKEFGVRHNIWRINNSCGAHGMPKEAYEHPALMPQELADDLIRSYSREGDLVLDPFMGSGTTARMAYKNNRDYIGFEIDPTYHELCVNLNASECNSVFDKL